MAQDACDATWRKCRDAWLAATERLARGSHNTRRAYEHDYDEFFSAFEDLQPWQVAASHVEAWIQCLRQRVSDATINRKLSSLSSFYHYASYKFTIPGPEPEGGRALWTLPNPFRIPDRATVQPYGRSVYPTLDDVLAILSTIAHDRSLAPVQRYRDLALLGGLFFTTRRVSEWVGLTWGSLHDTASEAVWFEYRYKGGDLKRQAIPAAVWRWIRTYLELGGRWGRLGPPQPVFIAESDAARRFGRQADADYDPASKAISAHRVNDLLKRYGRRVGVADNVLHAHGLRHAGARARMADGGKLHELREILGHSSIAVTQIYLDRVLTTPVDPSGDALATRLTKQLKVL